MRVILVMMVQFPPSYVTRMVGGSLLEYGAEEEAAAQAAADGGGDSCHGCRPEVVLLTPHDQWLNVLHCVH
jgi:hypothetical protein